ncbi:MAG: FecR family protein [Chitinophagaceae bacterium]|nr:FecR family protein [Chitinophagaceae bacterium]
MLQQYLSGELTAAEQTQLLNSLNDKENIQKLSKWIEAYSDPDEEKRNSYDGGKIDKMIRDILERSAADHYWETEPGLAGASVMYAAPGDDPVGNHKKRVRSVSLWFRYAAAAVVLGVGLFFYVQYKKNITDSPGTEPLVQTEEKTDVLPGSNKAVLTLSDGQQVALDESGRQVISDGKLNIQNNNGSLAYSKSDVAVYNTMTTPRGGQFKLQLADGTTVWLNAESSITYPTSFPGSTREVTMTGEAYFEVAKNPFKPFTVKTYKDEITVKGTSFNVNSYDDEAGIKTSLLEGAVQINGMLLTPGKAYINGKIVNTDLNKDLAWKNGIFNFHQVKLPEAMRQIARWYNVEAQFDDRVKNIELGGEIGRNLSLQQVLNGLQDKDLHFRLEGKVLTVY